MAPFSGVLEESDTTIALDGDFDRAAAHRAGGQVLRAPTGCLVHLEFGHVHSVQDAALSVLAEVIRRVGADHVALEGLSHHHETILRYLGVELRC